MKPFEKTFVTLNAVPIRATKPGNKEGLANHNHAHKRHKTMLQEPNDKGGYDFSGVALNYDSPFDRSYGEIEIRPGAFSDAIADPTSVRILKQHNSDWLIGGTTYLEDSRQSLYIEFSVTGKTQDGAETIGLIQDKFLRHMSVGFYITEEPIIVPPTEESPPKLIVTKAELDEVSIVTFPADRGTYIDELLEERFISQYNGDVKSPCNDAKLIANRAIADALHNKSRMMKIKYGN